MLTFESKILNQKDIMLNVACYSSLVLDPTLLTVYPLARIEEKQRPCENSSTLRPHSNLPNWRGKPWRPISSDQCRILLPSYHTLQILYSSIIMGWNKFNYKKGARHPRFEQSLHYNKHERETLKANIIWSEQILLSF